MIGTNQTPPNAENRFSDYMTSANDDRLAAESRTLPEVSIIVLTYKEGGHLERCLDSIRAHVPPSIPHETVVLANGLGLGPLAGPQRRFPDVRLIHSSVNLGFAGGCNRAAQFARGRYIALLNDDAEVLPGWLEGLVDTMESCPDVGAVGSRILLADGRLQEAGSVTWKDASTWGVGRGLPADSPDYMAIREVDYCSAASLVVPTKLWNEIGGMDEDFHPAYGEDVDFCFELRKRGYRVLYDPRSQIRHAETASSNEEFRTFLILRNRERLRAKWATELELLEPPPTAEGREAAIARAVFRATRHIRRVLVIDDRYPDPALGSGLGKMLSTIQELAGTTATSFFPSAGYAGDSTRLQRLGVAIVSEPLAVHLARPHVLYDAVIVSRPHNFEWFADTVRRCQPHAVVIYDAEALFYRRLELQASVSGDPDIALEAAKMRSAEERIAVEADHFVCISEDEAAIVARVPGHAPVDIVAPRRLEGEVTVEGFWERRDVLLAAGWLHGGPSPNADGFEWFGSHVLPLICDALPWVRVVVTGANPPASVCRFAGPNVHFAGHVPDLRSAYSRARLVIVPLRFGSGVKLKTMEALLHGVPIVATPVGAEGIDLGGLPAVAIADDSAEFAQAVISLFTDPAAWAARRGAIEQLLHRWISNPTGSWLDIVGSAVDARGDRVAVPE